MGEKTQRRLLLFLCLSGLIHCSAALVFWTAVVKINYFINPNNTVTQHCECGMFGRNSPLAQAAGVVVLPEGDPRGCDPVYNVSESPWIALVKRENCSFSKKINAAKRHGASAVVVYNVDNSGNSTACMSHPDARGIVSIMIGNSQGMDIVNLVKNGAEVRMIITPGNAHGPWMDTYWLYFMSIAFFIVTAASVAYFLFISANRLHNLHMHRRSERKLKCEAKKAIGRLQVRTLKRDDKETTCDSYMCAVCIESYKASEVVTVLTCDHIFHKACIEPWLLEKRTCPMCKCDILKALGVDSEEKESMAQASPQEVTVITVAGGEAMYEVPLTDPLSAERERQQHHYDNRAFEEEPARGQ
ncbi:RING finger protein 148-like [Dunckerocampus dactyliophorus]|uniref:RING finger protein 148-like n=1 Tax=Dunckerocampus dactyliophorus TaxID=161453 RepID=UPI00240546E3|nr:RING finger protein 148-like [Dunckerocampus dactyliophorus]